MPHAIEAIRRSRASSICVGLLPGITRPYRATSIELRVLGLGVTQDFGLASGLPGCLEIDLSA